MSTVAVVDAFGEIVAMVTGSDDAIELNTPPGCLAISDPPPAPDAHWVGDKWAERPPRPSSAHTWDSATKEWRDERPLDAVKRDLLAPLLQRLADEDARAIRPLAELVDALIKGHAPAADAKAVLAQLVARKNELRSQLLQIAAAGDVGALDAMAAGAEQK